MTASAADSEPSPEFGERAGSLHLQACDPALGPAGQWAISGIEPATGYIGALAWCRAGR
ncbi:MAG: hypothetical protein M3Q42_12030 [Pseudomonadota bacterium]|nr:hypothetical protein [Pseudomonadota bacterium]